MGEKKRKKFYIDRVQYELARRIVFHWSCFIILCALLVLGFQFAENPFQPMSTFLADFAGRFGIFFVTIFALIPVFVYDTMRLSHRFAGPMVRVRNAMKELASGGEVKPIYFRKGDFWKDVSEDFNAMLDFVNRNEEESNQNSPA